MVTSNAYHCSTPVTTTDSHLIQKMIFVSPILFDPDEELEMAAMPDQFFNFHSRLDAYLFETSGAFAYHNLFLRCSLNEDCAVDAREILAHLVPLLCYNRCHIGNLVAGRLQQLFAHDF